MPKLSELGLDEGAAPQIDWDAPEAGQQAPSVYPGTYTLRFKMPDDKDEWFDSMEAAAVKGNESSKRKWLVMRIVPLVVAAHANRDAEGQAVPVDAATGAAIQLPPQRISFFKSDKMQISQGGELLRALGVRLEGSMLAQIEQAASQLDGKVNFMAEIGWRTYFKDSDVTVSTNPRKKRGEIPWPKTAEGLPELLAVNPQTGAKAFGYPEIMKIIPPTAAK